MNTTAPMPVVVMISGSGTNLQAILDATAAGRLPVRVKAVLSDVPGAFGLERARQAGVPAECLPASDFADRASFDQALGQRLEQLAPGLVVLAGFMRILSAPLVRAWSGRMLNIHPSLLPKYRGLHTHRRVLEAGETEHGTSVHFVTEELDGGPLIAQARIRIRENDTETSLNQRIQALEHKLYPLVIGWFGDGRLRLGPDGVEFDGATLETPVIREEAELLSA